MKTAIGPLLGLILAASTAGSAAIGHRPGDDAGDVQLVFT